MKKPKLDDLIVALVERFIWAMLWVGLLILPLLWAWIFLQLMK